MMEHGICNSISKIKDAIRLTGKPFYKITHSTQPLEVVGVSDDNNNYLYDWVNIKRLSLLEVEETINECNVDRMAEDYTEQWCGKRKVDTYIHDAFKAGFNAHKELMKDKLHEILSDFYVLATDGEVCNHQVIDEFLLSKTEWDVEFVEGKLKIL